VIEGEPRAVILATGSELTRGETRDLNGSFLAAELSTAGIRVDEIALVPDDPLLLRRSLERALASARVVVFSGGLGPTADDHTVAVIADVFGRRVARHPEAERRMRERALRRMREDQIPPNYWKQAEVVEGAEVLLNPVGLAPGMFLERNGSILAVLPGVPRELQAMFRELVLPALRERLRLEPPRILRAKVLGHGESWAEAKIQKLGIDFERIEYGISAKPGELLVKFISHWPATHAYLDEVKSRIAEEFGKEIILLPEGLLDAAGAPIEVEHSYIVHQALLDSGLRVATAESCTGGLVSKSLTDHTGSSKYFVGSVIAYANEVKTRVLGVRPEILELHGAVSDEVCREMALGALELFAADRAIAVTGIAGPDGGTPEKPVGLVYVGLASRTGGKPRIEVERNLFWGNRENVRRLATVRALEMLRRSV
jgi:nicotinamide-nucleotide amidase